MFGRRRQRPVVRFYTRRGCGLCGRAADLVAREARRAEVRIIDVDSDPELERRYGMRVPVVTIDDVEVAELGLAAGQVRRALRARR
ncbi:MAG: glutaredoxin family protein [Nitriliruptoraceae bacterium]